MKKTILYFLFLVLIVQFGYAQEVPATLQSGTLVLINDEKIEFIDL